MSFQTISSNKYAAAEPLLRIKAGAFLLPRGDCAKIRDPTQKEFGLSSL